MPTISFDSEVLDTEDKLWELFKAMGDRGWDGSIGVGNDHVGVGAPKAVTLAMTAAVDVSPDGDLDTPNNVRRILAKVGDWKVTIGSNITTMTPEVYTASYGSP